MLSFLSTSLVPMFSFGENEIYDQVANPEGSLIRRIQNTLQTIIGLAPCMFIGRGVFQYSFGIVPFRKPIYTVGELLFLGQHVTFPISIFTEVWGKHLVLCI